MNIFRNKKENNEYVKRINDTIYFLSEFTRQTQSDYNFGVISEEEYEEKLNEIQKQIEIAKYALTGKVDENSKFFEKMMYNPLDILENLFDIKVHNKIEEIDKERNDNS